VARAGRPAPPGRLAPQGRLALAIDVGTGTQDVLLFDADREIENAVRLILPSPTVILAERIRAATRARRPVLLGGGLMGGGPVAWAARDHALAGLPIAAVPDAARTLDDDLDQVRALGIAILPPDAVVGGAAGHSAGQAAAHSAGQAAGHSAAPGAVTIDLRDVWLPELARTLSLYDVDVAAVDAVAVAVFDHGAAPPGVSDRRFRFERLRERLATEPGQGPIAFSYLAAEVPAAFTRLAAAAGAVRSWLDAAGRTGVPVLAMDTGPAAVLGALDDDRVRHELGRGRGVVAVNIGNFHTLAMRLQPGRLQPGVGDGLGGAAGARISRSGVRISGSGVRITGIFEHHTGELTTPQLSRFLRQLANGSLRDADVFDSQGHGALVLPVHGAGAAGSGHARAGEPGQARPFLTLTGPRRDLLAGHVVRGLGRPYLAVPHGDMMQAGPFGLLRALAWRVPGWREPITRRLG